MNPSFQEAMKKAINSDKNGNFSLIEKLTKLKLSVEGANNLAAKLSPEHKSQVESAASLALSICSENIEMPEEMALECVGNVFEIVSACAEDADQKRVRATAQFDEYLKDIIKLQSLGENPDEVLTDKTATAQSEKLFYLGVVQAHEKILTLLGGMTMGFTDALIQKLEAQDNAKKIQ